jgi:hypothetical protein
VGDLHDTLVVYSGQSPYWNVTAEGLALVVDVIDEMVRS